MKKCTLVSVAFLFSILTLNAQNQEKTIYKGFGFGTQIGQYQKDFGIGFNITSPYFANDKVAFRMRVNLMYNENIQNAVTTWTPYSNISFGVCGVSGMVGDNIRLYGEGGLIGILPSNKFSSKQVLFGGYGLFGFEFFMTPNKNYFIEIGGVGTNAKEDKIAFQPIYSNGLLISTGFRLYLK